MKTNSVVLEDCRILSESEFINWEQFKNSIFIITGATGLIGKNLVNALLFCNSKMNLGLKLYLPVRNVSAAEDMFGTSNSACIRNVWCYYNGSNDD